MDGAGDADERLADGIRRLLAGRAASSSICPSDVARDLGPANGWRALMEPVRRAAGRLAAAGEVRVTQGPDEVDPVTAHGPIRIRRGPRFATQEEG